MRLIHLLAIPVLAASLSGCVVREDRDYGHGRYYDDRDDRGSYRDHRRYDDDDNRGHCPPGHAKKGWC